MIPISRKKYNQLTPAEQKSASNSLETATYNQLYGDAVVTPLVLDPIFKDIELRIATLEEQSSSTSTNEVKRKVFKFLGTWFDHAADFCLRKGNRG